ncbi:DNA-binding protein [Colletotrichum camelliae]|nr:DNA-binding protein [Colletotrichum camelliae]
MFSSISRILGRTPQKNSSPGPTRPSPDDHDRQPFSSTAPPGIDLQFSEMSQDWGRADDADKDDEYDGPDGITDDYPGDAATDAATDDYVDPFADMAAFSTQVNDEDDAAPAYESEPAEPEPKAKKAKKAKKSKKTEDKETRKSKRKSKKTDPSSSADKSLPSPTTSGREDASDDGAQSSQRLELKVEPGTSSIPVPEKRKRKRKSTSKAADAEPAEAESAKPRKKRKTRKPLEDIEDDEMETQPGEMIPDSPSTSHEVVTKAEPHSADIDQNLTLDYTLQDDPQQSQLVSVSRQLFQPAKGTSTAAVSMSDDDREVSLSSPSVIAQRRRSMSRGSQISTFRQGLSRESTGLPDRISEAAESADENEAEDEPSAEQGGAAAVSDNSEDESQSESASDAAGDVSMADASAVASGAVVDGESQDDFADQLPPSSQPPREDTPSADEDAMDVDDDAADAQEESEEQSEPEVEQPHLPTPKRATARKGATTTTTATPGTARGRKANLLINMSDASHQPSSAQKSARSTSSKRQRSKPTFFAQDDENQEEEAVQAPTSPTAPTQKRSKKAASTSEPKASSEKRPNLKARSLKGQPSAASTPKPKAIRRLQSRTPSSAPPLGGLREGQFSMEEINRLNARLKLYQERHGLSREQLLGVIHMKYSKSAEDKDKGPKYDGELFKEFWDFVSAAFPDRKRQRVIDTTRQEYRTNILRGGGWTPQEDAKIMELHEKYNGSWAKIASDIGRLAPDIRARYKNYLICGIVSDERRAWTKDEEEELVDAVLTVARRMEKPYRREVTKPLDYVNWQSVSDEMDRKRSRLQCSRKWKQMKIELTEADLRGPMDDVPWPLKKCRLQIREMAPEDKYRLVESISKQAPGPDSAIKWTTLVDVQFRRKWHKDTLKLLWFRLKQQVPQWREKTVRDCARFLLDDAAENHPEGSKFLTGGDDNLDADRELKVISATRKKVNKGKGKQPAREQSVTGNELSTMLITASDAEEDEEDDEADETRASNEETILTQDDTQFSESASTSPRLGIAPSLLPPATQQANSAEPSPGKKRVRLSRGKTARGASEVNEDEDDSPNGTPTQSQFGDRAIPDRLTEKKMVARQRKTSGRAQSVASMQVDSVQNSDVDDDMPEIRVPPSTQPSRFKAINSKAVASSSQGNFARKTGSNVLPGEPVEVTEEVMAALAEAESSDFSEENETTEAAPVSARRRTYKKRPRRGEVAESPA